MPELPDPAEILDREHRLPVELPVPDVSDERVHDAAQDDERREVPLEKRGAVLDARMSEAQTCTTESSTSTSSVARPTETLKSGRAQIGDMSLRKNVRNPSTRAHWILASPIAQPTPAWTETSLREGARRWICAPLL